MGTASRPSIQALTTLRSTFGSRLKVCGIIDPDTSRAQDQIALKIKAGIPGYQNAATWQTPEEAGEALTNDKPVDLVIVGAPPHFRGSTAAPANLDLRLLDALAAKYWLVEKPVSAARPSDLAGQAVVAQKYKDSGANVAAGYMMCALKAVDQMKEIIAKKNLKVMGTAAR